MTSLRPSVARWIPVLLVIASMMLGSCASVQVRRACGPEDDGVHYYLPKPYIKVARSVQTVEGRPVPQYNAEIIYLPDPNERRTVIQRPGFGSANAQLKLAGGWNLTDYNSEHVGADPSSFLTAATGFAKLLVEREALAMRTEPAATQAKEIIAVLFGVNMHRGPNDGLFDERVVLYSDGTSTTEKLTASP